MIRNEPELGTIWAQTHSLLDHLIRPLQERRRDRQAEGLGGLQVDDELDWDPEHPSHPLRPYVMFESGTS